MTSRDAERRELERAIELLGRSTRLARFLGYAGAKYFDGQEAQLTEYSIATEVFGRSEKTFDATQDAVVRVEAHRLRKKLRDIYEKGGGPDGLQISLPAGSYVPKFLVAPEPQEAPAVESDPPPEEGAPERVDAPRLSRWTLIAGSIALVVTAAIGGLVIFGGTGEPKKPSATAQVGASASANAASGAPTEVHIMSGYTGSEVIDNSGVRWTPDRFFSGGALWRRHSGHIRGTSRQFLFANWRNGDFAYDIPMNPGSYELRLFFVSPHHVGDEKLAGFDISLGGKPLLTAFDVAMSAQGADVAEEKVFRDVTPDADGFVRLRFSNQIGIPALNALEITPGIPGKLKPIRISTQATSFVDHKNQRWRADDYYFNGFRSIDHRAVTGTDDPELFGTERYGHFRYAIPVDPRGTYTVVLHFAEFYFGPQLSGGGGAGSRIFHVYCNGQTLLRDFDIYKEGGSLRVLKKTFPGIKPSAQGKINLTFEPVFNNATVSAIEILDESN